MTRKLLIIAPCYHAVHIGGSNFDGIGMYINQIVHELHNGFDITVLATKDSDITESASKYARLITIPSVSGTGCNYEKMPWAEYGKALNEELKSMDPNNDIIFNQAQHWKIFDILSRVPNFRIYHYSHGIANQVLAKRLNNMPNVRVLCGSKFNFDAWVKEGYTPYKVVPMFTSLDEYPTLNRNFDPHKIIFVGRIYPGKGIVQLLEIAHALIDYEFVIYGSSCNIKNPGQIVKFNGVDFYGDYFEDIVKDIVSKLPNVDLRMDRPREETVNTLRNWEGYMVSMSPEESSSIVALESTACGIPIGTMTFPKSNIPSYIMDSARVSEWNLFTRGWVFDIPKVKSEVPAKVRYYTELWLREFTQKGFGRSNIRGGNVIEQHIDMIDELLTEPTF